MALPDLVDILVSLRFSWSSNKESVTISGVIILFDESPEYIYPIKKREMCLEYVIGMSSQFPNKPLFFMLECGHTLGIWRRLVFENILYILL